MYEVYVKINDSGYIIAVNSSGFLTDVTGWVKIDSGTGRKYLHAQGNYFPEDIYTESGVCRYKLADGAPVECTAEEIAQQEAAAQGSPALEERVSDLEASNAEMNEALDMILVGVTE